ncbi:MAG: hypothetical protein H6Q60_917 [Oscillospiraceae bacterium]|nr:hypothetical protein [Oscillospiraceae bacterium]
MTAYTPEDIQSLLDHAAREQNLLPLTSRCDSRCIFCSHHNNPKEIQVISIGTRTLSQIEEAIYFLNPEAVITIGESASSIIEGEPTLHPQFREIMNLLRRRCPDTPVAVTTNGHHLTEDLVSFLSGCRPVELNLSLNSGTLQGRRLLMGDDEEQAGTAIEGVKLLERYRIPFQGSLVGMPNVTGYDDVEHSIRLLAEHGARAVRVFLPGFSSFVKRDIFPNPDTIYQELSAFIDRLAGEIACPVLLEPSWVSDLVPKISGIAKKSPAYQAGLRRGDVIVSVNGKKPRSRTEAFRLVHETADILAAYTRNGELRAAAWQNGPEGSGLTFEYDFDLDRAAYMKNAVLTAPGHVLLLTSEFGSAVVQASLDAVETPADRYTAIVTPNKTFGGTIRAAGLLTCDDYLAAYESFAEAHPKPAALMVPAESFNSLGRDLKGTHYSHLTERTGLPLAFG